MANRRLPDPHASARAAALCAHAKRIATSAPEPAEVVSSGDEKPGGDEVTGDAPKKEPLPMGSMAEEAAAAAEVVAQDDPERELPKPDGGATPVADQEAQMNACVPVQPVLSFAQECACRGRCSGSRG